MNGFSHLNLEIGYSAHLIQSLVVLHLSAVIALSLTALPFFIIALMLIAITLNYHSVLHAVLHRKARIVQLLCYAEQRAWYVIDAQGIRYTLVNIEHFSHFHWLMLVKVIDDEGRRHWVVIPRDAVEDNAFRRLSVMLQYHLPVLHPASKS